MKNLIEKYGEDFVSMLVRNGEDIINNTEFSVYSGERAQDVLEQIFVAEGIDPEHPASRYVLGNHAEQYIRKETLYSFDTYGDSVFAYIY